MTSKPAASVPTFDSHGVANLLDDRDIMGDFQSLQLIRQKGDRMFSLWIESGARDEASFRDLTPADLRQIGEALIAISEDHK